MSDINNQQINAEYIKKWQRLDELDSSSILGKPISDEKYQEICASIKNGTYLQEDLEIVQKQKQKLLKTLALIEEIEMTLKSEISQQKK